MPVSNGLRRLLRIRDLEEEQQKLALSSALGDLQALEQAFTAAQASALSGREEVTRSAHSGDGTDRLAGMVQVRAAERFMLALRPRIAAARLQAARLRQQFLDKRVERRQAETLIRETESQDAVEASRRGQQTLDEWFRTRARTNAEADRPVAEKPEVRTVQETGAIPEEGTEFHP